MRITINQPLFQKRARLVRWTSLAGLVVLFAGLMASFDERYYTLALPALLAGFVLANISAYNANRYVKEPRADRVLEKALKGFDNNYHLFCFTAPVPYVLLTPTRVYALAIKAQDGTIRKQGSKWRRSFSWRRLFLFFGEEALGDPTRQALADADRLRHQLTQELGDNVPPVAPLIVFTHPQVRLEVAGGAAQGEDDVPAVTAADLKKYLRNQPKTGLIEASVRRRLLELLKSDAE